MLTACPKRVPYTKKISQHSQYGMQPTKAFSNLQDTTVPQAAQHSQETIKPTKDCSNLQAISRAAEVPQLPTCVRSYCQKTSMGETIQRY
jgi:hypothetical protein